MLEQTRGHQGTAGADAGARLVALLLRISIQWQSALNRGFRELGVTAQEAILLLHCSGTTELPAGKLAKVVNRDKGGISRHLDRLSKKGLIERLPSGRDRRLILVRATPSGRRVVPHIAKVLLSIHSQALNGVLETELEEIYDTLSRISISLTGSCKKFARASELASSAGSVPDVQKTAGPLRERSGVDRVSGASGAKKSGYLHRCTV